MAPPAVNTSHPCQHEADFSIFNTAVTEIKDTLKHITDLLTSNAVLEEQAIQFRQQLKAIEGRLHKVEIEVAQNRGSSRWVERVVWLVISAGLGVLLALSRGGGITP